MIPDKKKLPKAFVLDWKKLTRWGVNYNQLTQAGMDVTKGTFPVVDLESVLTVVQYGTSQKANSHGEGTPVIRMTNIDEGRLDLDDMKWVKLPDRDRCGLLSQKGDILINRTNSKELVGKCAVFDVDGEYVFASYLVRLRVDSERALPEYISFFLNSPLGRRQIDTVSRQIIGQANINTEEIRGLQIPLPGDTITQKQIMQRVQAGLAQVDRIWDSAEQNAKRVKERVEQCILNNAPKQLRLK